MFIVFSYRTGDQDYGIALAMISYLKQEDEYIPWKSAFDNLGPLNNLLHNTSLGIDFKSFVQHIIKPIYEKVGGMDEVEASNRLDTVKQKSLICSWACRLDVSNCVEKSVELFKSWMLEGDPDHINP